VIGLTVNPIIGSFFHPIYLIINASTLGHSKDPKQLAGFGLGSLTLGICVISIGSGFAMGAGTLISQAFGAKDLRLCAIYRNRQIFLSSILYLCLAFPMLFIRSIYSLIGQDPEIADYAATYVHIVLPSLYFFVISQSYAMFASNQRVTWISTCGTISGVSVHFVTTMILYELAELGFRAVPISTAIHFMVRFSVNYYFAEFGTQF
jgi:Na+-driven multidrug efflux pump